MYKYVEPNMRASRYERTPAVVVVIRFVPIRLVCSCVFIRAQESVTQRQPAIPVDYLRCTPPHPCGLVLGLFLQGFELILKEG